MSKIERGGRIRITTRLTQPWRRFIRLRAGGRNRIALAWRQADQSCCRQVRSTG